MLTFEIFRSSEGISWMIVRLVTPSSWSDLQRRLTFVMVCKYISEHRIYVGLNMTSTFLLGIYSLPIPCYLTMCSLDYCFLNRVVSELKQVAV